MATHKLLRINENIKQSLSFILMKEIEDPRIKNNLVTITKVDTTKDLKHAKIYFTCLDETKKDEVLKGFMNCKGVMFSRLKKTLKIRYVPDMSFLYDSKLIEADRVLQIIHELDIKKEDDNGENKTD